MRFPSIASEAFLNEAVSFMIMAMAISIVSCVWDDQVQGNRLEQSSDMYWAGSQQSICAIRMHVHYAILSHKNLVVMNTCTITMQLSMQTQITLVFNLVPYKS